ncbi:MAG: FxLYD domain-containing protein, partial [Acidobacteria bacterium]|nr:FxLYD domain-containing protein [Acidobacteriota bacterium]
PDAEAAEDSEVATAAPGLRLVVGSWDQEDSPDGNGVMVVGTLRNDGANVATSIQLQVQVLDGQGAILGTTTAQLTSTSLGSGDVLNFRAHFPELAGFDTARFDISGREFRPAPPVTPEGELSADDALRDREPEPAVEP